MRKIQTALAMAVLGSVLGQGPARGQEADEALKDRVAQLVERLDGPKAEARATAEKALIGLGPRVLPLLPEVTKSTGAEKKERLERIRAALREAQEQANLGASKVTIKGQGIRLSEAIRQLQAQTGNPISDLREQMGADVTNPSLDLDLVDKPFFEALDIIAKKADVAPYFTTGDGTIGLMAAGGMPGDMPAATSTEMVRYSGPFRIVLKQVALSQDFETGARSANAQFFVAWEPRLRPMLLAWKAEDTKIVDDRGKEVMPSVMAEATDIPLRPDNPVAEININMVAPERSAAKLARFKVKADITVPAALRTFRFPKLDAKNARQTQGDIAVVLEDTDVDEQVWKVHVTVEYPGGGPAFESYRQGLFNNRLWLQRADGSKFEHNGGYNNTASDQGKLGFEYLFVEAPGQPSDYQFVYETPSKVITIPLEFEYKDVPLP